MAPLVVTHEDMTGRHHRRREEELFGDVGERVRLVRADVHELRGRAAGGALAAACFTCHGTNGNTVQGVPPSLAGRSSAELFQTMKDFQSGKRAATIMHQQARGYSDEQLRAISIYVGSLKAAPAAQVAKP